MHEKVVCTQPSFTKFLCVKLFVLVSPNHVFYKQWNIVPLANKETFEFML
jgi:hypothetical protein